MWSVMLATYIILYIYSFKDMFEVATIVEVISHHQQLVISFMMVYLVRVIV